MENLQNLSEYNKDRLPCKQKWAKNFFAAYLRHQETALVTEWVSVLNCIQFAILSNKNLQIVPERSQTVDQINAFFYHKIKY